MFILQKKYLTKMLLLVFGIFIFFSSASAQIGDEKKISKEVWKVYIQRPSNTENIIANGKKMLALSQNDYDRARGYTYIGDALKKQMRYNEAIQNLEKADFYAKKNDFTNERFMINILLSVCYLNTGLSLESNDSWNIANEIAQKTNDLNQKIILLQVKTIILEDKNQYCKSASAISEYLSLQKKVITTKEDKIFILNGLTKLTFAYLKCGSIDEAKAVMIKADSMVAKYQKNNQHLIEEYYLCKGMISAKDNNYKNAKLFFNKADSLLSKNDDKRLAIRILEERLLNNIDTNFDDRNRYYQKYISLNSLKNDESKKLITQTIEKEKKEALAEKNKRIFLSISIVFLLIISSFFIFSIERRRKKTKKLFEEFMQKIENQGKINTENKVSTIQNTFFDEKPTLIKDQNTENQLLANLEKLENAHFYTAKGITLTKVAAMLNTNTTYITYLIKTHRNLDFSSYINKKRIEYIVRKIKDEPQYSNYKISYLADESGFATHSQFGSIFKAETGISPSQYLELMKKEQEKLN